ncbi:MAG: NAAT family transporter [Paludibacterium sp.]|uniref:MarC family protein n=1 Tax=Paludibacterium sp. TaxID=1917523 RepID=UPI0025D2E580|nr:MarC family protein [Paludibacterium sp.]MBV8046727.1 NAAT family transporter [Paludibacterium sp.]MBV8649798.1 NAAT family transporter [Paludibacterium sp.]
MELEVSKIFMALLVLINPLSAVPIFIGLTPHSSQAERKKIAKLASITIAAVVCLFSLVGQGLLSFLGISIGSFQVAGGLLVLMIALAMMNAQPTPTKTTDEERSEAESKANIAVVPLAIPLMSGPGAISTVIIYATTAHTWLDVLKIIISGVMVAIVCYGALNMATPISRVLGKTGINIVNRVMGMLLAALSVEIMVDGLYRLFPHLGGH